MKFCGKVGVCMEMMVEEGIDGNDEEKKYDVTPTLRKPHNFAHDERWIEMHEKSENLISEYESLEKLL